MLRFSSIMIVMLAMLSHGIAPVLADSSSSAAAAQTLKNNHAHADWAGLWIGVEGLFVFITLGKPGEYELEMMGESDDPKDNLHIKGHDAEGGIAFERDDKALLLHAASGDETGLKWLMDKKDCLMVEEFEGFCRD